MKPSLHRAVAVLVAALLIGGQTDFAFALASSSQVGTSGAVFLKIAPGARPVGMGEAFTGVADDVHAAYWNPAGLAGLKVPEMTGMHMQYFQSIQYEYFAFAYPTPDQGTWGLSVTNLHVDNIDSRTDDTDTPAGQFSSSDSAYWLSYAYPVTSRLNLGANAKYIRQTLDNVDANAYATDLGATYDFDWQHSRLGATIQNVGTKVKFVNESDPLPLTMRFGGSVRPWNKRFLFSSDIIVPRDNVIGLAVGGEYNKNVSNFLGYSIRSGYNTVSDAQGLTGVSVGAGLRLGRGRFDFAWVPFGELGNSYRFALHIRFGAASDEKPAHDVMQSLK